MLKQPQKSAQADALWTKLTPEAKTQPKGNAQYALDGGALLYWVPRPRGSPIYKSSVRLVLHFPAKKIWKSNNAIVVFDGYIEMSAKAITQQGRASGKVASTVTLTESMSNVEEG